MPSNMHQAGHDEEAGKNLGIFLLSAPVNLLKDPRFLLALNVRREIGRARLRVSRRLIDKGGDMNETLVEILKVKKLLLMSIFFAFAIIVPPPTMAGAVVISGISRPPIIVSEAPPEVKVIPANGVYVVAADADRPQAGSTGKDEKRRNESLEKRKPTESKGKSNLKINVLPRPDNMKSPIEKKEDQFHLPPDRF